MKMIINVEHLLFEFRIYVEHDAESSDVRLRVVGATCVKGPSGPVELLTREDGGSTTAYDRVDDRLFPDPSSVPIFDTLNRSTASILGGRVSRE